LENAPSLRSTQSGVAAALCHRTLAPLLCCSASHGFLSKHPALKEGAFDVQQTAAVQAAKFVRRLGALDASQLRLVEQSLADVLGLKLAGGAAELPG